MLDSHARLLVSLLALGALALPAGAAEAEPPSIERLPPARIGQPFPAGTYPDLNAPPDGPPAVDLAATLGKKPIVFFYWVAGHPRADAALMKLQQIVTEAGPDKLALFAVTIPRPGREVPEIRARIAELGVQVPVLNDERFELGQRLVVQSVPSIAIVDAAGSLRLANGGSLRQEIEYKLDVEGAVRRAATSGSIGSYGFLGRYEPVLELVGERCPDFAAPLIEGGEPKQWHDVLSAEKLNVLVFWSVDCPHCKKTLPELNEWLKANRAGLNVYAAASVPDEATRIKTREFCEANGFVFPTFADADLSVSASYHVTTTPTVVIIRPDGVVDSALLHTYTDLGVALDKKRSELL